MADEVIIGNVGGDGVASEATLAALVRAVERMGNARGQKGTGDKTQALANKAIAAGTTATTANTGSVTGNTGAVNKSAEALGKFSKGLGNMAMAGIGTVLSSLGAMSKELLAGNDSMEAYASKIPIVGGLLGALAGYADRSVDSFRKMSAVGAGFNNDIGAMRKAAAQSNLSLDEFTGLITQNSENLRVLGTTVAGGVARFGAISKVIKDTGDFESLKSMGFSVMEINEGLSDYAALQSRLGRLQGMSNKELAAGTTGYLKELDQLSKITGKSRKEMAATMEKQASDAGFRALANQFKAGSVELSNFNKSMALIETLPADVATGLKDLADGIPQTEEGIALLNAAGPQLADAMKKVGQGADPQVLLDAMKQAGGDIEKFAGMEGAQRAAFIQSLRQTNPALAGVLDAATRMTELGNKDLKKAEEEQAARNATTEKLTTFQDAIRKMSEAIQVMFVDSGLLDLFATGIGMAATLITGMADSIKEFTAKFKEDPAGAILNLLGDSIKGLFSNTTVIAALVGGIAALFLGKAALGAMSSAMSGWAEKSIGKMFGGGAGPVSQAANPLASAGPVKGSSAGKGFGQAMGNIGKGLGQGIGGVLKGLAAGLKAFANPAILIGAGILGGAIVAIGAGIAGATWLLGKALPTFAEGLKSFADIDGNNLLNVAKGIAGVGAALAVFGAGAVVGSVGAVISNILDALPGKSPLEKLKEFADADLNTQRIINNANAMVAYSNAMKGFTGGPSPEIFTAFKTGIVSLLGGETNPLAPIKAFGEMKFNTSGIVENAKAVKAYSEAMKDFPSSPSASVFTALKDGIIGLLGGSTDVLAPIKAFGEIKFNTSAIKSNAEAVLAYSKAMKDFPSIPSASLFTSAKDSIISLLGGSTDVLAPIKAFGEVSLNTATIKSNAEAVSAYGEAMKNFPQSPSASVFTALKDGIIGLLGGSTDVLAPIKAFNNITLDPAKIKLNAEAMAAFGDALSKVPEVKSERTGGLMGAISSFFGGDQVMPWDRLREFGDAKINAEKVVKNAQALSSFGNALKAFQGGSEATANISISDGLIKNLGRLSTINADGLVSTAAGLQSIADVKNLAPILTGLNSLDATKLVSYNTALKDLTKTLEALNKELAKENKGGMFGMGDSKANAGDLLKNISLNTSQGAGNSEQLSGIMSQVLEVLKQMKEVDDKIEKNTKGFGSDISVRDVTSM